MLGTFHLATLPQNLVTDTFQTMSFLHSNPKISVLLPVRNAEPFLELCLQSLARQTFEGYEVIAIDDGSTDGSGERLESWSARDGRFRCWRRPHLGLVATLNEALGHSRGELIARLDADDAMSRQRLGLQVRCLEERPEIDIVSCRVSHFPRHELGEGLRLYEAWLNSLLEPEDIFRERFVESPLPHPSVMLRKETLINVDGYRDMGWPEDYDLWLRLLNLGHRACKLPNRLYFWRDHPERATRVDPCYNSRRFLACKAHHLVQGPLRDGRPLLLWGAGQTGRRLSRFLLDEGAGIDAFIDIDPKKVGRTRRDRPIHGPDHLNRFKAGSRPPLLVAVSARGARALIRTQLTKLGWSEGRDYWCVA